MAGSEPTPSTGNVSELRLDLAVLDGLRESITVHTPLLLRWTECGLSITFPRCKIWPSLAVYCDDDKLRIVYDIGMVATNRYGQTHSHEHFATLPYELPDLFDRFRDTLHRWYRECVQTGHYNIHLKPWEVINVSNAEPLGHRAVTCRRSGRVPPDAQPAQGPPRAVLD